MKAIRTLSALAVFVLAYAVTTAYTQSSVSLGGFPPFIDSNVLVMGSVDKTKGIRLEADTNITTATTRVWTAPDANGTVVLDTGTLAPPSGVLTFGRLLVSGFTPTCTSTNATSAAIATGSTDLLGSCTLTGDGTNSTGVITLTFSTGSAYGTNAGWCILTPVAGTAAWGNQGNVRQQSTSTTAPTFSWTNGTLAGGAVLTNNSTYGVNYLCAGR